MLDRKQFGVFFIAIGVFITIIMFMWTPWSSRHSFLSNIQAQNLIQIGECKEVPDPKKILLFVNDCSDVIFIPLRLALFIPLIMFLLGLFVWVGIIKEKKINKLVNKRHNERI
jgi:tellurite resistance protein TehA-like permease